MSLANDEVPHDPSGGPPRRPSLDDRIRLVRLLQAQACRKAETDPIKANLGVINGDILETAHTLHELIAAALAAGGPDALADRKVCRSIDMWMKMIRQSDRLSQIDRLPSPAADPPSDRVRPWSEDRRF
jgi:hypothetical protein